MRVLMGYLIARAGGAIEILESVFVHLAEVLPDDIEL